MIAEINGTRVYYEVLGTTGPKVVFLHGWGCSTELMKPVTEQLKEDHRILLLDFPGHGKSGRPPEPWGVPEYAACIREVQEQTGCVPCDVIAHSFGARVALWLASKAGEENRSPFRRIILTGAAGIRKPPSPESQKRSAEYQRLKKWNQGLKRMKIFGALPDQLEEKLRQKYGSADYNALDEEMRRTFVKVIQQDLTPCLAQIQNPTLLMFGDQDTETPLWMGQKMAELIPDAGLVTLTGGSHFAYLEQLDTFMTIANTFLSED